MPAKRKEGQNKSEILTNQEERFCREYLVHGDATRAAKLAGYHYENADTARACASKLRNRPKIKKRLQDMKARSRGQHQKLANRIVEQRSRMAFFDPIDLVDDDGEIKAMKDIDPEMRQCIQSMEVTQLKDIGTRISVKLVDKNAALVSLEKQLGLYEDSTSIGDAILTMKRIFEEIDGKTTGPTGRLANLALEREPAVRITDQRVAERPPLETE